MLQVPVPIDQNRRGVHGYRRRAAPAGADKLALHVLSSSEHERAGGLWRRIESDATDVPPFARWDWTELWLDHFGDLVPHQFLVAERAGLPCGAVLLTRSARSYGPLTVRGLHLGTAGEPEGSVFVEYNALCARRPDRADMARAAVAHAHRSSGWDELHLDGFDPAHAEPLLAADPNFSVMRRGSRLLELDAPVTDLINALPSKSTRATVRRSVREISPYTTEWAQDSDRAHAIMEDLVRLHQERWRARGEPGAFASARFREFHRRLIERWLPEGRSVLFAVRCGGETVAALYGFVVGDTLQYYQGGVRISQHNKVRTGYAAHLLLAEAARQRGLRSYEYLAGDSRFKTDLSTTERTLVWATLTRRRPRAMAIRAARAIRRRLQRT